MPINRMASSYIRRTVVTVAAVVSLPAGLVLLYFLGAVVLGLLADHRDFRESPGGTTIYVISEGVHTDLVIPASALSLIRSGALPVSDLSINSDESNYIAVGWGDREFYLTTPTWADLRLTTAWRALSGSNPTLLHVEATAPLAQLPGVRKIRLSDSQLAALASFVEASFALDVAGKAQRIAGAHYDAHDAFYVAQGHYSLSKTCNEWVREALDSAGVRSPLWSPFPSAIFYQLSRLD
jgi:uncharacterized protein (TIGR02117 family)